MGWWAWNVWWKARRRNQRTSTGGEVASWADHWSGSWCMRVPSFVEALRANDNAPAQLRYVGPRTPALMQARTGRWT